MIAFATLLLGLYLGTQTVELAVAEGVARVEVLLDGRTVARIEQPPWTVEVDLGGELRPHELEAIAYDEHGREVDRARQTVNLPRPLAEAEVVISGAGSGNGAVARVTWNSIVGEEPRGVSVHLDGRPLAVADPRRIELPPFDPRQLHFLSVELEFDQFVSATVEATFGGTFSGRINHDLTTVPVVARGRKPTVARLQGRLRSRGRELRVLAVDEGPADVVIVRDLASHDAVIDLIRQALRRQRVATRPGQSVSRVSGSQIVRWSALLKKDQTVRFLWPFARQVHRAGTSFLLFPPSAELTSEHGGLLHLMSEIQPPAAEPADQRLADAVAVAGMMAASRNRRRAVVLVLAAPPVDSSQLAPEQAASYLRSLAVPLRVWNLGERVPDAGWPEPTVVANLDALEDAARRLAASLERQRIVWVEGLHLPNEIEVGGEDSRIRRAG